MSDALIFIAILTALAIGFYLGAWRDKFHTLWRNAVRGKWPSIQDDSSSTNDALVNSLIQLFELKSDEAIESYIGSVDVNDRTLEIHLALGSILRRRGEYERAVRIHQHLLERPTLSAKQFRQVQMELAVDYLRSGILDRAEQLLNDFANHHSRDKNELHTALKWLIELYQDTHDWKKAIDTADRLTENKFSQSADIWRHYQSQYCCELALENLTDDFGFEQWLKNAVEYDKRNARAYYIKASRLYDLGDWSGVVDSAGQLILYAPQYCSEVLPLASEAYSKLGTLSEFYILLSDVYKKRPDLFVLRVSC